MEAHSILKIVEGRMRCLHYSEKKNCSQMTNHPEGYMTVKGRDFLIMYSSPFSKKLFQSKILKASEKHKSLFGTGNTDDVIKALYLVSESGMNDLNKYENKEIDLKKFEVFKRMLHDNFLLIIDTIEHKLLRLDLFRNIMDNKNDFEGGILHTLSHFTYNREYLSVNKKGSVELPFSLVDRIVDTFYFEKFIKEREHDIVFENEIDSTICKFIFYFNKNCGVYFLTTIRPKGK